MVVYVAVVATIVVSDLVMTFSKYLQRNAPYYYEYCCKTNKGAGPTMARNQFSDEYPNPPRINRRASRRVLLDRLDRLLQTEQKSK
jgi:hypothetical protein